MLVRKLIMGLAISLARNNINNENTGKICPAGLPMMECMMPK